MLNIQMIIRELGVNAPAAPVAPNAGCILAVMSGRNVPPCDVGSAKVPDANGKGLAKEVPCREPHLLILCHWPFGL